jgi:hypothetical protein
LHALEKIVFDGLIRSSSAKIGGTSPDFGRPYEYLLTSSFIHHFGLVTKNPALLHSAKKSIGPPGVQAVASASAPRTWSDLGPPVLPGTASRSLRSCHVGTKEYVNSRDPSEHGNNARTSRRQRSGIIFPSFSEDIVAIDACLSANVE